MRLRITFFWDDLYRCVIPICAALYPGRTESPFVALLPKHVTEPYPEVGQLSPYRHTACLLTIYKLITRYL